MNITFTTQEITVSGAGMADTNGLYRRTEDFLGNPQWKHVARDMFLFWVSRGSMFSQEHKGDRAPVWGFGQFRSRMGLPMALQCEGNRLL